MSGPAAVLIDTIRPVPTPEGIELTLRLPGPIPRAAAWLTDFLLRLGVLLVAAWMLAILGAFGWGVMLILAFLLEWLAMAAFEVWADGATPGKRALGLMVLHDDGTPVRWPAALVRNLMRAVDFLPAVYGFGLAAMASEKPNSTMPGETVGKTDWLPISTCRQVCSPVASTSISHRVFG